VFEELLVGLIADIGQFMNNAVNEGCGQNTLSKRRAKKSTPKSGVSVWGTEVSAIGRHYQVHCQDLHWA
jgi:hypothetical protein